MNEPQFRVYRWQSKNGLSLYSRVYEKAGPDAPAVLCLPGLARNSKDFEDLALHLSPHYRVVCPDLRGRGQSEHDPVWQNYEPGAYLADLAALVAGLGIERLVVIGTSMGGLVGMMLPAVLPGRVVGLILNDIGPEIDPAGAARIRNYMGKLPPVRNWDDAVTQLRTLYTYAWPNLSDEMWVRIARRTFGEDANGVPAAEYDPKVGDALRATPESAGNLWPVWAQLHALPVLSIRGELSDILSATTVARMQREKPDLVAITAASRGHVPLLDEPECVEAIDAFLARVAPPSGP